MSMSLPDCALALDVRDRDAALDGGMHDCGLVRDRVGDVPAQSLVNVGRANGAHQPLFEPVDDDAQVDRREVLFAQQIQLAAGAVKAAHAKLGDEQHQIGLSEQGQRPVGPARGQIHEDRPELALRNFHDLDQLLAGYGFQRNQCRRRGDHFQPARMPGGGCSKEFAVEASPGFDQVEERQAGTKAELKCGIAELEVEIEQANFAPDPMFVSGCLDRKLRQQGGCADPAHALDHADHLAVGGLGRRRIALHLVADRQKRRLEIGDVERKWNDVVGPCPDQRADERQWRLVSSGDERRTRRGGERLEPLHRSGIACIDLHNPCGAAGQVFAVDRSRQPIRD